MNFHFLSSTIYNDAVSLYVTMKRYRSQEYAMNNSGWVLLDTAEQIFKISRERVYNSKDGLYFRILQKSQIILTF